MPLDNYNEVLILTITSSIVFLVVTGLVIFILLFYQKKKFLYQQQLIEKEKMYSEQLLQAQLEMQEHTFNTISEEIHDNVGQTLSLAKVQLNILEQKKTWDESLLAETKDSVNKAMTDLRDIAKGLNSDRIRQSSLPELITHELTRISRSGLLLTQLQADGREQNLPDQKKLIAFRIIQEALQNIIKHANARAVTINCQYCEDRVEIKISDDGNGFDQNLVRKKDGLGLQNMMNRAALIGGKAQIDSMVNKGTTIIISAPYV